VTYERNAKRLLAELDSRDAAAAMRVYAHEIAWDEPRADRPHVSARSTEASSYGKARCLLQPVLLYWL